MERFIILVFDPTNGELCRFASALSKRCEPNDAIGDLRCRERTVMRHMGIRAATVCGPSARDI